LSDYFKKIRTLSLPAKAYEKIRATAEVAVLIVLMMIRVLIATNNDYISGKAATFRARDITASLPLMA
jgi:hypothetical protein